MTARERYGHALAYYAQLARLHWHHDDDWIDMLTARCTKICDGDTQAGGRLARDVIWGNTP